MGNPNSEATRIYGARIINRHLQAMRAEVEGVRQGEDIEYIHRMRVASRRMRTALNLFKGVFPRQDVKNLLKEIRNITQALGTVRDLDVQLAVLSKESEKYNAPRLIPGFRRLRLRLEQQRADGQHQVEAVMDQLVRHETLNALEALIQPFLEEGADVYLFSPALYALAFKGVHSRLNGLWEHEPYIHDENNIAELHKMRIAAKHHRYTLETFEGLYGPQTKPFIAQSRDLQDMLGAIHDNDVWNLLIPQFMAEERERILVYFGHDRPIRRLLPGLEAFRADRMKIRSEQYQSFLESWDQLTANGVWGKLEELISTPLDLEAALHVVRLQNTEPAVQPEGEPDGQNKKAKK